MDKIRTRIIGPLLLTCLCFTSRAQNNSHFESWNSYSVRHLAFKHLFWIRNDIGIRASFDENPSTMFLLRPRLEIGLWDIVEIHPAVDFRYSYYPNSLNSIEIRTWQGVRVLWPDIGRVMFDHFYRFEQRFHWFEGFERDKISLRSRYRIEMRIPVNHRTLIDNTLFIDLRGEVFIPHDNEIEETYASTIRLGLNLGYRQNQKWRYQLTGYIDGGKNT